MPLTEINTSIPLALQTRDFGTLDRTEEQLICRGAIDLVLLENSNELCRQLFMSENVLETVLERIGYDNTHHIHLDTVTFNTHENNHDNCVFTTNPENRTHLTDYIQKSNLKLQPYTLTKDTIIYTIIALNFLDNKETTSANGGHYGAIICDMKTASIYIFDSMSGTHRSGYSDLFKWLATRIFIGKSSYTGLHKLTNKKMELKFIKTSYILQATGGFPTNISPILQSLTQKRKMKYINIQHTDSQNHFCYIWCIWMIHIYLQGGISKYNSILKYMKSEQIIPIIVIKKYIMGLINILHLHSFISKPLYPFFKTRFLQIWSNHLTPLENNYKLYSFSDTGCKTLSEILEKSWMKSKLISQPSTSSKLTFNIHKSLKKKCV